MIGDGGQRGGSFMTGEPIREEIANLSSRIVLYLPASVISRY